MDERDSYDDRPRSSWRPTLAERSPAPDAEDAIARRRTRIPAATYLWWTLGSLWMGCGFFLIDLGRDEKWAWPFRAMVFAAAWFAFGICMNIGWKRYDKANSAKPAPEVSVSTESRLPQIPANESLR
jgi:hypothetical protein